VALAPTPSNNAQPTNHEKADLPIAPPYAPKPPPVTDGDMQPVENTNYIK